jgi:hypothetical protein
MIDNDLTQVVFGTVFERSLEDIPILVSLRMGIKNEVVDLGFFA